MAFHKRKKMARRPVPSMENVQAALEESDDEGEGAAVFQLSDGDDVVERYDNLGAGSTASAAAPGAAAVARTEISDDEPESDEVLDEDERKKRSEEKGKGRAVHVDATDDAATGGVPPVERDEPPRHGDASHLGAFHAGFADTASGAHARSPSEEGGSAGAGQRVDSNASRYAICAIRSRSS